MKKKLISNVQSSAYQLMFSDKSLFTGFPDSYASPDSLDTNELYVLNAVARKLEVLANTFLW